MILLIILFVYIISCRGAFLFIQKAHYNPDGIWNNIKPNTIDIIVVFFPYVNTITSIHYLFKWYLNKNENKNTNFFKPK